MRCASAETGLRLRLRLRLRLHVRLLTLLALGLAGPPLVLADADRTAPAAAAPPTAPAMPSAPAMPAAPNKPTTKPSAPSPRAAQEKPRMTAPTASRPPAPHVAPVEHAGVRYEQDRHDDSAGDQPGGYLAAYDARSNARLWRLKVYQVSKATAPGAPAFAIYFSSMRLAPDGRTLEITNEAGGVYQVDLAARTSKQVSGPPETGAEPAPDTRPPMPKL